MRKLGLVALVLIAFAASLIVTGCGEGTDANVASHNLSKAAEQFEIERRIVFYNGITDKYMLVIEGACSIEHERNQLEVTCKDGDHEFKKDFLGLSDNVTYVVEQLGDVNVSTSHYRVIFKPSTLVPDIEVP